MGQKRKVTGTRDRGNDMPIALLNVLTCVINYWESISN